MGQDKKLKPFGEIPESFKGLKDEGVYYVDKTGFIPYLISQKRKICVVTRPRRFGKTLMLRTLETFFERRLDDEGKPIDNHRYFEGLKVMDAGEDVLKEMGQYPVISLSLKGMRNESLDDMVIKLRSALASACSHHAYLLEHPALLSFEREQFGQILSEEVTQGKLEEALGNLCSWIYKATNRKTVILLDEYDVPLQQAAIYDNHHPGSELFEKTVKLVGNFISAGFKSNSNLAYGIIAGCMRVAKESIFTGMNNPGVITVTSKIPDEFWGFTQQEVEKMLVYYGLSDRMDALKHWYEGYYYSNREVYNPWSLLNAIRGLVNDEGEYAIQSYWSMTSSNDIIDDMIDNNPEHRNTLAKIMEGEPLWAPLFQDLSCRDLKKRPEAIWSFLLYTGYLKSIEMRQLDTGNWEALMTIPNMEIRAVMNQAMQHWWKDYVKGYDARKFMDAIDSGEVGRVEREINTVLSKGVSCFDYNEAFYHGTLYAMIRTQTDDVKSNAEYGNGRPDIVVLWNDKAIVLELKRVYASDLKAEKSRNPDKRAREIEDICINTKLNEALIQIEDKEYQDGVYLAYPAALDVVCYAAAFCGRRCMVRKVG